MDANPCATGDGTYKKDVVTAFICGCSELRNFVFGTAITQCSSSMVWRMVAESNKQRFEFSEDRQCIRALQGHSINVDVELKEEIPPEYLYHGTSVSIVPKIMEEGLCRMSRQYVHLSIDESTAMQVGARRKCEVAILKISARKMREEGYKFWLSRNNIWLTETVPPQYLEPYNINSAPN